ncbi:MAG: N-acetyltransferase [Chloroflexi bacterium]|nr:N-acetyltransferase [Chloroflexota bacterium]
MTIVQTPDLVEAPSWSIRPELPVDLDQIHDLHRAAFRGPAEAELVDAVRAGSGFLPELSLVAVAADGSVLGHIMISLVGFDPASEGMARSEVLALAPLAVLPPHWNRGIGTELTRTALEIADQRDEPFVAVLGAPSFYARFGFRPAADEAIHSPYDAAGSAFQVRPLAGASLEPGTVVYPPMFGEL